MNLREINDLKEQNNRRRRSGQQNKTKFLSFNLQLA